MMIVKSQFSVLLTGLLAVTLASPGHDPVAMARNFLLANGFNLNGLATSPGSSFAQGRLQTIRFSDAAHPERAYVVTIATERNHVASFKDDGKVYVDWYAGQRHTRKTWKPSDLVVRTEAGVRARINAMRRNLQIPDSAVFTSTSISVLGNSESGPYFAASLEDRPHGYRFWEHINGFSLTVDARDGRLFSYEKTWGMRVGRWAVAIDKDVAKRLAIDYFKQTDPKHFTTQITSDGLGYIEPAALNGRYPMGEVYHVADLAYRFTIKAPLDASHRHVNRDYFVYVDAGAPRVFGVSHEAWK